MPASAPLIPLKVYVAGPYSAPDPAANTRAAIMTANALASAGFVPFVPHLSLLWQTVSPHPHSFWLEYDLHWLRVCDAVFLLPGKSPGAMKEAAEARRLKIPVFTTMAELQFWRNAQYERS